jgi:hypothetical protein
MPMHHFHFRVQTVLLTNGGGAHATLAPVEWMRKVREEGEEWEYCEPVDAGAEPFEPGTGKMTELRFVHDPGFRPEDFVTVSAEATEHNWTP